MNRQEATIESHKAETKKSTKSCRNDAGLLNNLDEGNLDWIQGGMLLVVLGHRYHQ